MKRYLVTLHALASVKALVDVYAVSAKDAENKALEAEDNGDVLWEYDGLQDGTYVLPTAMEVVDVKYTK